MEEILLIIIIIILLLIYLWEKRKNNIEYWNSISLEKKEFTSYDEISKDISYPMYIEDNTISLSKLSLLRKIISQINIDYNLKKDNIVNNEIELINQLINSINYYGNNNLGCEINKIISDKIIKDYEINDKEINDKEINDKELILYKINFIVKIKYENKLDDIELELVYIKQNYKLIKLIIKNKNTFGFFPGKENKIKYNIL